MPGGAGTVRVFTIDEGPAISLTGLLSEGTSSAELDRVLRSLTLPAAPGTVYDSWRALPIPVKTPLFEVVALDAQTIVVSGAQGVILRFGDAGSSWVVVQTETDRSIVAMDFDRPGAVGIAESVAAFTRAIAPLAQTAATIALAVHTIAPDGGPEDYHVLESDPAVIERVDMGEVSGDVTINFNFADDPDTD